MIITHLVSHNEDFERDRTLANKIFIMLPFKQEEQMLDYIHSRVFLSPTPLRQEKTSVISCE